MSARKSSARRETRLRCSGALPLRRCCQPSAVALAAHTARVPTSGWPSRESMASVALYVPNPNPREARWAGPRTRHRMRMQPRQQP